MTLQELQDKNKYTTDKGTSHTYLETYEKLFRPYKDKEIGLVEVGVRGGGSLSMWEDYFSKAQILGIDITSFYLEESGVKYGNRVKIHIEDIRKMKSFHFNEFSIAIDDGSHRIEDQLHFVKIMLPVVKGLIIVEDIQRWAYIEKFKELGDCEVVDMREEGHHDNVLVIYRT